MSVKKRSYLPEVVDDANLKSLTSRMPEYQLNGSKIGYKVALSVEHTRGACHYFLLPLIAILKS